MSEMSPHTFNSVVKHTTINIGLKQLFEMISPCTNTGVESLSPLVSAFYPRDALPARSLPSKDVRLSVRLSHSGIVSKQIKISWNFFHHLVAPSFQFYDPCADTQFQGEPRQRRRKIHGGGKNWRFSTEVAVNLGNGARKPIDTMEHLIGNYRWQIVTCRFRWPWVTFDRDFKVTTFLKSNIKKKTARLKDSYYMYFTYTNYT